MDHARAAELHAAERYLLGELAAEEAEDFERHYFECAECAEAVEGSTEFVVNARAVLAEEGSEAARAAIVVRIPERSAMASSRPRLIWMPAAAAVAFAAIALYEGAVVIPGLKQAQELPAFQLAGLSRGPAATIRVRAGTAWLALATDLPSDVHFPKYVCELTSGDRTAARVEAAAPAEGQAITVLVPGSNLAQGDYEFIVYGLDANGQQRDKVSTSTFHFQIQ